MGAIGHPGDIERLRMAAIELASTEGFTRSAADVSLRRLAFYSLSPLLKTAFEQVYGAPYLARMIFAEVGATPADDLFLRVEYDGAIAANGTAADSNPPRFSVIAGTTRATSLMEELLRRDHDPSCTLNRAMKLALDAWSAGSMPAPEESGSSHSFVRDAARASGGGIEERDGRGLRAGAERAGRDPLPRDHGRRIERADRGLTSRSACSRRECVGKKDLCGVPLPGSGWFVLAISFVWFVRLPVPMHPATTPQPPLGPRRSAAAWWCWMRATAATIPAPCAARCWRRISPSTSRSARRCSCARLVTRPS